MDFKSKIRYIQDFPIEGILFRDITTFLKDAEAMVASIDEICKRLEGVDFDLVLGPESRGFIFGMPVAYKMKKGFVPVRKAGKLPGEVVAKEYALEYGTATIEIHKDAIQKGTKVVVIDDLLATGGTSKAVKDLVEEMGGEVVKMVFFIDLPFLNGREQIQGCDVDAIVTYE